MWTSPIVVGREGLVSSAWRELLVISMFCPATSLRDEMVKGDRSPNFQASGINCCNRSLKAPGINSCNRSLKLARVFDTAHAALCMSTEELWAAHYSTERILDGFGFLENILVWVLNMCLFFCPVKRINYLLGGRGRASRSRSTLHNVHHWWYWMCFVGFSFFKRD